MLEVTAKMTMRTATGYANWHIVSAAFFAGQCAQLEQGQGWPPPNSINRAHRAFAFNAVISAVCALEAHLNELRAYAAERSETAGIGKLLGVSRQISELWDTVERQSMLRKYDWMLSLCALPPLDKGSATYQAVSDLVKMRDALVHAKPEWGDDATQSAAFEKRLRGKFPQNSITAGTDLGYFPYRCLGAGAARWSVESALQFVESFASMIEARHLWAKLRPEVDCLLRGEPIPDP